MKEFDSAQLLKDFYVLVNAERSRLLQDMGFENTARREDRFSKWYGSSEKTHEHFYHSLEAQILAKEKDGGRLTAEDMLLLHGLRYCARGCWTQHKEPILPFVFDAGSLFTLLLIGHADFYRGVLVIQEEFNGLKRTQEPFGITLSWKEIIGLDGNDYPEYEYKDKPFENLTLDDWYFRHKPSKSRPEYSSQSIELHVIGQATPPIFELPLSEYDHLHLRVYSKMPRLDLDRRRILP